MEDPFRERGLDDRPNLLAAFASIPISTISSSFTPLFNDTTCPICLEDYEDGQQVGTVACGHFFHVDCLRSSLAASARCPTCRGGVFDDETTARVELERVQVNGDDLEEGEIDESDEEATLMDYRESSDSEDYDSDEEEVEYLHQCQLCQVGTFRQFMEYLDKRALTCFLSLMVLPGQSTEIDDDQPLAVAMTDAFGKALDNLHAIPEDALRDDVRMVTIFANMWSAHHERANWDWAISRLYDSMCVISAVNGLQMPAFDEEPEWPLNMGENWKARVLEMATPLEEHNELVRRITESVRQNGIFGYPMQR